MRQFVSQNGGAAVIVHGVVEFVGIQSILVDPHICDTSTATDAWMPPVLGAAVWWTKSSRDT